MLQGAGIQTVVTGAANSHPGQRTVDGVFAVSGEPVWWHTVQVGPVLVANPVSKWQKPQLAAKLEEVTEVWFAPVKGTGWFAPPFQKRLLWTIVWQVKVPQVWFAAA
jgi:hypothetical protein